MEKSADTIEEKISHCLHLMKKELGSGEGPNFKRFWEVRQECLTLFKAPISLSARAKLWENYIALADEAKMTREHIEEDSKFASEQLDLAIDALEKEVALLEQDPAAALATMQKISYPPFPKTMAAHHAFYVQSEDHIQLLTLFGSKVHELRKELVKMSMRVRFKAKGFDRLSKLGDRIFPLRKRKIEELSECFCRDVDDFAQRHFAPTVFDHEKVKRSLFFFREEIKQMQALGTLLSLNSLAFTRMRTCLSGCWDQLKGMEKEVKKEFSEQKIKSSENARLVREKIESCRSKMVTESLSLEELAKDLQAIHLFMRGIELIKSDVVALKKELLSLGEPLEEEERRKREEREAKEAALVAAQTLLFEEWLEKLKQFNRALGEGEVNAHLTQYALYKKEIEGLRVYKHQKQQLEREIRTIAERIAQLKEKELLSLSAEDKEGLERLQLALVEQKELRKKIKQNLEEFRKKKGGQGLDVLQALALEERVKGEKEALLKVNALIEEVENKISTIS